MTDEMREALQRLPSIDEAVRALVSRAPAEALPRWVLVQAVRDKVAELRRRVLEGELGRLELDPEAALARARALLRPSLRPVLNATGVVLHTNLGRAPLSARALERIAAIAEGYSNLEYQLEERRRGSRHVHAAALLQQLCGAEAALVTNNNAAAVLLCLTALAQGREVVVSRGELIEIGGSFRLPDIMAASGARLREVGTTNRTHLSDYQRAIGPETALLLKAHRSNFALVGFTAEVAPEELSRLGREHGIPTVYDLGSGGLLDLAPLGLPSESTVQQAIEQGFDLTTFSGDKLLGGPQAGIIVGKEAAALRLRHHPLMRAMRPDKLTLAALEATLEAYREGTAAADLPTLAMLGTPLDELRRRASRLRSMLRRRLGPEWSLSLLQVTSRVGGGALPQAAPPSWAVAVTHPRFGADAIEERLRASEPPVLAHIEADQLLLDLRTVLPAQLQALASAVAAALAGES